MSSSSGSSCVTIPVSRARGRMFIGESLICLRRKAHRWWLRQEPDAPSALLPRWKPRQRKLLLECPGASWHLWRPAQTLQGLQMAGCEHKPYWPEGARRPARETPSLAANKLPTEILSPLPDPLGEACDRWSPPTPQVRNAWDESPRSEMREPWGMGAHTHRLGKRHIHPSSKWRRPSPVLRRELSCRRASYQESRWPYRATQRPPRGRTAPAARTAQ